MGSEWPIVQLGEIVDFLPKRYIKKGEIAPFVSMADVPEHSREISNISEKEFSGGGSKFKNGDTIFARITPCLQNGKTAKVSGISSNKVAHGSTEFIVFSSIFPKTDQDFVYYLALDPEFRAYAESRMQGSTGRQRVAWQDLAEYKLNLPPKEVRKNIGLLLASLDNKIELNRQTNQTLEQMAQALFKSWFVDFDPVIDNALAAGKPIPEELQARAQRRQQQLAKPDHQPLPDDVLQLFPSEFEETEALGWVPKGWEVKSVNEAVYINPRVSLAKGSIAKFADMKALPTNGYSITNIIDKEYSGGAKFQNGDVLLARITPCLENGKTGVVDFLNDDEVGFGSTEFIVMRRKGAISMPFVACLSRDANFRKHCMQSMVGSSGRQRVQNSCFDAYHLAIPQSDKLLMLFEQTASTFFSLMTGNKLSIGVLENLRDTLLPKLISGELRLPESLLDSEPNPLMDEVS